MSTTDNEREELADMRRIILEGFRPPDRLHGSWWINPERIAQTLRAAGFHRQGPVTDEREALAKAWEEGHKTRWRRGWDDCQCSAWSSSECACGRYGTGELLSLGDNPYREAGRNA